MLATDCTNAFGSMNREGMLRAIENAIPKWVTIAHRVLNRTTKNIWIDEWGAKWNIVANTGVDQGDPMSAALFGITMTQMLGYVEEKAHAENMEIQIIAYLDDAYVICKRTQATRVMEIMEDTYKLYDMTLNQAKSQWWTPHMVTDNSDIGQIKFTQEIQNPGLHLCRRKRGGDTTDRAWNQG